MSTILDALKKSEQERKLNQVPKLSDMPVPQESPRWPLVVIAILSLVLALVIGVLISQWLFKSQADSSASAFAPSVSAPSVSAPSSSAPSSSAPSSSANAALVEEVESVSPQSSDQFDVVVNVVSYAQQPQQRFVVLDGEMYRENDFVRAGLKVHEIKADSVIFNWRGELVTRTP